MLTRNSCLRAHSKARRSSVSSYRPNRSPLCATAFRWVSEKCCHVLPPSRETSDPNVPTAMKTLPPRAHARAIVNPVSAAEPPKCFLHPVSKQSCEPWICVLIIAATAMPCLNREGKRKDPRRFRTAQWRLRDAHVRRHLPCETRARQRVRGGEPGILVPCCYAVPGGETRLHPVTQAVLSSLHVLRRPQS